mmetsp:Transcript_3380/g.4578  ORF Transcript_3380/g.4578 Transcript_3380/m.4578 type:complete len:198 (+) Transcript_3380:148-741(+)|eukprot:CAMPEP_0196580160 /NCGR_PEP_ID=MMETSP1081-20130531/27510_1 /TAXON_ID=36882 /ORGANISM="Pyramimonas amylifera, Strain CCMP720" /LENGTH=197 /DNA_ID=CAMNT_0041899959 /DNA_START=143 /DNA_END=736 /DNA_ORIENTATION=-
MNHIFRNIPKVASDVLPCLRAFSSVCVRDQIFQPSNLMRSLVAVSRQSPLIPFAAGFSKIEGFGPKTFSTLKEEEDDTHEDFKPVSHVAGTPDVDQYIKSCLKEHRVFLFMKGNPNAPQCGFSMTAVKILKHYGVSFGAADVLLDPELREGVKQYSKWPTIPQLYIDKEFVGGSDILLSMHESGELKEMLGGIDKKE